MKIKSLSKALDELMNPNKYMRLRHPKAAKRRRIVKKWRNRFGADQSEIFSALYYSKNSFLERIPRENFIGGKLPVPLGLNG